MTLKSETMAIDDLKHSETTGAILKAFYKVYNSLGHGFLKAAEALSRAHETQLINYLRATEFEVGLLLNFGSSPEYRRKIFTSKPEPFDALFHPDLSA